MYKEDNKILRNKNLEQPDKTVLEKAKSIMPAKPRRKMNSRQIVALATSLAVIVAVIVCIPFMLPAQQAQENIPTSKLSVKIVESLEDFSKDNELNILYFTDSKRTIAYTYNNAIVFIEEKCEVNGVNVNLLIKINDNCKGLSFEKEVEYSKLLSNAMEYMLSGTIVYIVETEDYNFLTFSKDSNQYYISLSRYGNGDSWKTILEILLN